MASGGMIANIAITSVVISRFCISAEGGGGCRRELRNIATPNDAPS